MTNGVIDSNQKIVTNGLVLHLDAAQRRSYSGSGTVWTDLSGNGNNGTLTNDPTFNSANSGSIQFDGSNDNVLIPNATSILSTTALTVAMWVKWTTVGTTTSTIQVLFDNNHNSTPSIGVVIQDRPDLGKRTSFSVNPAANSGAMSTSVVGNGTWRYVVGTFVSGIVKIYVNGVLEGQANQSTIAPIQPNITLGIWQFNNTRALNGTIATTAVYNRALSDTEVLQNYNATKARFEVPALLDLYPNAAAAYSLRKLRSGYTGSAIRVRRSSDNTEQDIGFTSTGDLDTTALTTFVGANNGFVSTWYDQSGNNRNATQATTTAQPEIVNAGTIITLNSKPVIRALTDRYLTTSSTFFNNTMYSTAVGSTAATTTESGVWPILWSTASSGGVNGFGYYQQTGTASIIRAHSGNLNYNGNSATANGALIQDKLFLVSNLDTVDNTSAKNIVIFNSSPYSGTNWWKGTITEAILYGSDQSPNRIGIETNINSYYGIYNSNIDSDAQSFITTAAITDSTQQGAVDALVKDLKNYGLWTKMKAIYPFVGGTAASHKFNLKDPRDVDGAFRLVFNGGWTHSSTGALPNGTTGWAETYLNPSLLFNNMSFSHLSYYSRTNSAVAFEYVMGVVVSNSGSTSLIIRRDTSLRLFAATYTNVTYSGASDNNSTDGRGYFIGTQQGNNVKLFRNASLQVSNTNLSSGLGIVPGSIVIGALKLDGVVNAFHTNKECAFATIGDGLTDTEAANLYTAVQKYQTTLGRQV